MIKKKKILSITSSRSDFYILLNLYKKIQKKYFLDLIVCGNHFDTLFGKTIKDIKSEKIKNLIEIRDYKKKNSTFIEKLKKYLIKKKPDLVLILGDRLESYCLASACKKLRLPIFHISGGDTSLGSKDDLYRDFISKVSSYHFVKTNEHKKKLEKIGIKKNIFVIGSLAIENLKLLKKNKFSSVNKPFCLVSFHPVTMSRNFQKDNNLSNIFRITKIFNKLNFLFTASSHDKGGNILNKKIQKHCKINFNCFFIKNLGKKYLSAIKESKFMLGNSSSGIIESSFFGKKTINILPMQLGRQSDKNVINVKNNFKSLNLAVRNIMKSKNFFIKTNLFDKRSAIGSPSIFIKSKIDEFIYE